MEPFLVPFLWNSHVISAAETAFLARTVSRVSPQLVRRELAEIVQHPCAPAELFSVMAPPPRANLLDFNKHGVHTIRTT